MAMRRGILPVVTGTRDAVERFFRSDLTQITQYIVNAPISASVLREPVGTAAVDDLASPLKARLKK